MAEPVYTTTTDAYANFMNLCVSKALEYGIAPQKMLVAAITVWGHMTSEQRIKTGPEESQRMPMMCA